jgi:peptidoglycan/LPS O-acetylase OafA/YrhL
MTMSATTPADKDAARPMSAGTSLYLDLVRFSAAFIVFIEHFRERTRNGLRDFWGSHPFVSSHMNALSQTAVIVFFVLSGYVIAHVLATRERTPLEYAASRVGRLYSVVVPALLLTAAANWAIELRYPDAFDADGHGTELLLRYGAAALYVNCFWLWPRIDLANAPFWSLSFEAVYYVAIALFVFTRRHVRFLSLLALALLAGPSIMLLAPVWLLGFAAYHVAGRGRISPAPALLLWAASALLLATSHILDMEIREPVLDFMRTPHRGLGALLAAYAAGLCFAGNLLAFDPLAAASEKLLRPFTGAIRFLGSMTFALYLFHQPLMSLALVYPIFDRYSAAHVAWMLGGTLLVVATIGRFCEKSKSTYKEMFLSAWRRAAYLRGRYLVRA